MKTFLKFSFLTFLLCLASPQLFAQEKQLTIVALGDSTTAGTPGFQPSFNPHAAGRGLIESQYAYWLMEKHPNWKILNRGINGERSDQILNRFDRDVIENKADLVVVIAGVNDIYQRKPIEEIKTNLKLMHERAKENKIGFIVCTVLPYDIANDVAFKNIQDINQWILNYSKENKLPTCDTFKATSHPKNPRMLVSSSDHIHPDINGYKKMSEPIEKAIRTWQKKIRL